ncbi:MULTISPECIES: DUF4282 domain-containing protein [Sulfurimonas]|uniref:DUF4282 domain-containing protein n=1 Tax=Sulfurimonas TaxID=202746 RepID=UPI00125FBD44|nr:DUF4282 domain-containing protein [Sulfurimonas hydrogeniphila]
MWNILSFNTFIAQDIFIFFYYIFALFVPVLVWKMRFFLIKRFSFLKERALGKQNKLVLILFFGVIFLCMELCLRILFEGMIGYFDMHDYLYKISQKV